MYRQHTHWGHTYLFAIIILMAATSSMAETSLRWSPDDTLTVAPGATGRLAIHLDDVLNLRTIEVTVTFDTTYVTSLGGGSGSLYTDSGFFVFDGFEEDPGQWHGFAIIMGAGEFVTGPGELLFWDFQAKTGGQSPVVSIETKIYNEASPPELLPDVLLAPALIIVDAPISATENLPSTRGTLQVSPNPFNPRTRISFDLPQDSSARMSVFDMRGRQVAVLYDGLAPEGNLTVDWNGTDDAGQAQPGGVYLFQLETNTGVARAKGILVK